VADTLHRCVVVTRASAFVMLKCMHLLFLWRVLGWFDGQCALREPPVICVCWQLRWITHCLGDLLEAIGVLGVVL
jgi:hypothetical protein